MIRSIQIKGLRGIREGSLAELTPLVVLVGPNGCGKSTVIEGLLIGAAPNTGDALRDVVLRHEAGGSGPRWLLWRAGKAGLTEITVTTNKGTSRACRLELDPAGPEDTLINYLVTHDNAKKGNGTLTGVKNKFHSRTCSVISPLEDVPEVHLIEGYPTEFQKPLHDLYSEAALHGRRKEAIGIISEVFPGFSNVEILTEHGEPILNFNFANYSVPANLAGDGIQSLLRLSLELSTSAGGLALLEEPEVHQHPAAIRRSARAILAAVRRQVQVVLTTHSLELIDSLLAESSTEDLDRLSLYRLQLQDGSLTSSRLSGPDIAFSRAEIEDDLR